MPDGGHFWANASGLRVSMVATAPRPSRLFTKQKLSQPAAEETRTAGLENARAIYFLPQWSGVLQNQFQVLPGKRLRWAHQPSKGEMIISDRNTSHGHATPSFP